MDNSARGALSWPQRKTTIGKMIVIVLGDLDSNQEWRIQSPLFCQLNYLPLRCVRIPHPRTHFKQ